MGINFCEVFKLSIVFWLNKDWIVSNKSEYETEYNLRFSKLTSKIIWFWNAVIGFKYFKEEAISSWSSKLISLFDLLL